MPDPFAMLTAIEESHAILFCKFHNQKSRGRLRMSGNVELEKAVLEMNIETSVKTIKALVEKDGWRSVLTKILVYLDRYLGSAWFGRNWYLLSLIDAVELVGIDYDVEDILKTIDDVHDFSQVQEEANEMLIEKVREQLREGYPTYFYN
ncbi:MAG: hypothetical protein ACTSWQ_08315, partial [Candidatus Thorarchaeota archaeon]